MLDAAVIIDNRESHLSAGVRAGRITTVDRIVVADTIITRYDALFVTAVRDPVGNWHNSAANAIGWIDAKTDPTGHADAFAYDSAGNVVAHTNRRAQVVTFAYDALDQLQSRTADGQTTTFTSDPGGSYSVASSSLSYDSVAFDVAGRATSQHIKRGAQSYTITSSYDAHSLRTGLSISSPWSASIGYHYNAKLQLDQVTDLANRTTSLGFNGDQQLTSIQLPTTSSLSITTDYPATHTPSAILYNDSNINGTLGAFYSYTTTSLLDARINAASTGDETGRQFSYDPSGRLTGYADYDQTGTRDPSCDPGWIVNPNTGARMLCSMSVGRWRNASTPFSWHRVVTSLTADIGFDSSQRRVYINQ